MSSNHNPVSSALSPLLVFTHFVCVCVLLSNCCILPVLIFFRQWIISPAHVLGTVLLHMCSAYVIATMTTSW